MSQNLDLGEFKETAIIKKLKKSKSKENLQSVEKRGRKPKYATVEERNEARKKQQKAYRERKKKEVQSMKEKIMSYESKKVAYEEKGSL